jgi:YXWGXW repeat-containing protein
MSRLKEPKMKIVWSIRNLLLLMGALLCFAAPSFAQVGISVSFEPPALPVYEQPVCPGDGYIWTPGYWAYADDTGYYWVPGTWVEAPQVGFLWTPGYWGWGGSAFIFHAGYWGPTVGFYGGVSYGFGYFGHGYEGGRWDNGHFFYNRAVNNVNVTIIHNVYETRVTEVNNRVSYNGGRGGIEARPSAEEERAERERHIPPLESQTRHVEEARSNPNLRASENHGKPPIAATQRPSEFKGNGAVGAREAGQPYKAPERTENNGAARTENNTAARTGNNAPKPSHVKDVPAPARTAPNTGNAATDRKYQAQQDKMYQQQDQERQKLAGQQEKDHQRATQQKANDTRNQQLEQKHQQQTDALVQKHTQQQQHLQQKQAPPQHPAPSHGSEKPK